MTSRIRPAQAVIFMSLAVLLAACSSTAATPAPSTAAGAPSAAPVGAASAAPTTAAVVPGGSAMSVDACVLVTEQDAVTLLGSDPGKGIAAVTDDGSTCAYDGSLVISVVSVDGQAAFDAKKANMPGTVQTLTGVGDSSFATITANTVADMEVLKGPVLISVMVQGDPSKQNITTDSLSTIGKAAVNRL